MLPLKHILCPIDFSADSYTAVRVAGGVAHPFAAHLTVLHVVDPPAPNVFPYEGMGVTTLDSRMDNEETIQLRRSKLQGMTRQYLPNIVNLSLEVTQGDPAQMILEMAHRDQTDMVVIAPHGHGRLRKAIFGSTAEKVVKDAPCPVVTMHAGQESKLFSDVAQELQSEESKA